MENEKQSINIKLAGRKYNLKVTGPEQEEMYRKAAEEIDRKFNAYQLKFKDMNPMDSLAFAALNVCVSGLQFQNELKRMKDGEEELAKELGGYLDNIDKNSR